MKILSIQFGHNATVAYMEDGELKYVLQEEKFDNIKNSSNFPLNALSYIAKNFDLTNIDRIAVSSLSIHSHLLKYEKTFTKFESKKDVIFSVHLYDYLMFFATKHFYYIFDILNDLRIKIQRKKNIGKLLDLLKEGIGVSVSENQIDFVEHHLCHALSPVYFYGLHKKLEPTLIFTLDGGGDKYCATVRVWREGKLETLATTRYRNSLGFLWASITSGMGMKPSEHEYKIMGLAAYSEEKYFMNIYEQILKRIIWIDGFQWKTSFPFNRAYMYLRDKFYGNRFDAIAGALQYTTETLVLEWMKNVIEKTGIRNIATSGGVFMNVKLNKKIQEADFIDTVYFMPSCGDESNVIGAIFGSILQNSQNIDILKPINSMYSGLRYKDDEIINFINQLDSKKYNVTFLENDENCAKVVATMLAKFEIIGVVRGAGEWGARSLCNRTILANASDLRSFHIVNDMIKMRDFWMPFAPVILEEYADKYIKNWDKIGKKSRESHQFMISAVDSTLLAQKDLIAAIHQKDKTLRPQLVSESNNKWMFNVLKEFEAKTKTGGMMNTSLNIHGYPLVGTLEQAMFTMDNSGMNNLLIGNYLIVKKSN